MFFNELFRDSGFGGLLDLQRRIDHLFDEALAPSTAASTKSLATTAPTTGAHYEVSETNDHYLLSFDMPGVPKDKLQIEVRDNVLRVTGERNDSWKDRKEGSRGRFYGRFETALALPEGVESDKIEASYEDGVLRIAIPRAETSKPRQIKIGDGKSSFWTKLVSPRDSSQEKQKTLEMKGPSQAS